MSLFNLPSPLDRIFTETEDLSVFFDRLMVGMVDLLKCDRCHLYFRDPQLGIGQILHCHTIHPEIPNSIEANVQTEVAYLAETNPLFAAALDCAPTIFIEDLDELIVNSGNYWFWSENYQGVRALAQAHVCLGEDLWGTFQAAQFNRPRPWTKFDRSLVSQVVDRITPLVSVYVRKELRGTVQYLHDGQQ